jgi:hypothetical protein
MATKKKAVKKAAKKTASRGGKGGNESLEQRVARLERRVKKLEDAIGSDGTPVGKLPDDSGGM